MATLLGSCKPPAAPCSLLTDLLKDCLSILAILAPVAVLELGGGVYLGGGSLEAAFWPLLLFEAWPEVGVKFVSTTSEARADCLETVARPWRE